ncbi:MAG: histidine--tRNA ligase [Parvularculaceae bacterium]|nr:histidine--tRNA ligase [Parvularculaceae bacterium]
MADKQRPLRPKARVPRGFRDRFGAEIARERDMLARISSVYESFGFDPLETPAFEYTDALGKFLPDIDRPNQGVFSLQDDDEQWMSLRYDLTAPLARYVAENYDALPKPFRRYAVGSVWRNEKPGPGRFRQFTQCDADTVGAPAPNADVESVLMLSEALEVAGLQRGEFQIRLNDRNALTGLLETLGLADDAHSTKRLGVLRAMDKLDRLGEAGVALLLGPGRKDDSGDYTEGARLADADIARVMAFMQATATTNADTCARLADVVGGSPAGAKGVETLAAMAGQLKALGFDEDRAKIDLSVIRGLEYYTGPVFEAELLTAVKDAKGRPVRIGSVASGGRYDGLVERFKGVEVPAVGISIGVSRLLAALELKGAAGAEERGPVVILALENDQMADYQRIAAELRAAGLRAEVYVGGSGMKAQMKYADKRNAPVAVIIGGDERARGEVTIKDLVRGAELSKDISDNAEWREGKPAQTSVKRADLVAEVKKAIDTK